jgi:hypothetical protein
MTPSPDSLIPSDAEQSATEKRDDKAHLSAGRRGESAGRNTSERRISIVNSTSEQADSTGALPGASLCPRGEACHIQWFKDRSIPLPPQITASAAHSVAIH